MRKSDGAVAVVQRAESSITLFLARWNRHWESYNFVSGHRRQAESFRECIIREIVEELNLESETDFCVSAEPLIHLEYTGWSESAKVQTFYTMELFAAMLTEESSRKVNDDLLNRWVNRQEILNGKCENGKRISPTMQFFLDKAALH